MRLWRWIRVSAIKAIIKYPGSKWKLAEWIIGHFPKHHSYLEPFFGSGAVLFNKVPSAIETVNDLDNNVVNLFNLVRSNPEDLAKIISLTPFSRFEYDLTFDGTVPVDDFEKARRFLIQCWQGHGFRTNGYKVGWKNDVQGRDNAYAVHSWYRLPGWIINAADRLKQVQIENKPADEVIKRFRYPNVLIYADPPYILGTRTGKQYKHEMTNNDHLKLLEVLDNHPGPVVLSGYASELYDNRLKYWQRKTCAGTSEHGGIREEVIWINNAAAEKLNYTLF